MCAGPGQTQHSIQPEADQHSDADRPGSLNIVFSPRQTSTAMCAGTGQLNRRQAASAASATFVM